MVNIIEDKKREEFRQILIDLSKDENLLKPQGIKGKFYQRLKNLYGDDQSSKRFRHYYSDIFEVISSIENDPEAGGTISALGQNIDLLQRKYDPKRDKDCDISLSLKKLSDHVSLDIARLSFINSRYEQELGNDFIRDLETQKNELKDLCRKTDSITNTINQLKTDTASLNQELAKISKDISKSKVDMVAILGVFAAIVIGSVGALSFSSQLLANIKDTPSGRFMIAASLCGLVTIVIFHMVYLVLERIVFNSRSEKPWLRNVLMTSIVLGLVGVFGIGLFLSFSSPEKASENHGTPEHSVIINQLINTADTPHQKLH